jgi:hypothetical protein
MDLGQNRNCCFVTRRKAQLEGFGRTNAQSGRFGAVVAVVIELPTTTCRKQIGIARFHPRIDHTVPLEASSSFRRGGLRDDRRRRLLTDDLSDADDACTCRVWAEDGSPPTSECYGNAEFLEHQWQLLDLVPRRLLVSMLLLLAGIGIIAGLEAAYAWSVKGDSPIFADHGYAAVPARIGTVPVALDIGAKGSLACWFSSLTLLAAAVSALLVYTVRRHRTDDYQGRYRVWLWAAVCWFLAATDQAASIREGFREVMIGWTGTPLWRDGSLWWVVVYVLVFGAVGSRLLLDMRPSRLSIATLTAAAIGYGLALACHLGWRPIGTAAGEVMFRAGSEMGGHLMLLAAMGLHVRYVILDAQGLILHPEPRKKAEEPEEEAKNREVKVIPPGGDRWRAIDPPHAAPPPTSQRLTPQPAAASVAKPVATPDLDPSSVNRKLTKGERRALKERLLRERQAREKQKW